MKIAVMADTHDNLPNIRRALDIAIEKGAGAVLHAGDVISPFAAKLLAASGLQVRAVFGNNDGERTGLGTILDITEEPRTVELEGRKILLCHDPSKVSPEDKQGSDVFVFGHTHEFQQNMHNGSLELNPGEAGGWLYGRASFAILDLETMEVEQVEV